MNETLKKSFQKQAKKEKFSLVDIEQFEKHFNIILPSDYKDFLLTYGSVVIKAGKPDSFLVQYTKEEKPRIEDILNFLSLQEIIDSYKILREDKYYEDESQVPSYMIPIAHTNESYHRNYILLNTQDSSIWLTIEDESMESNKDTFGLIAASFNDFLEKIEEYDNL